MWNKNGGPLVQDAPHIRLRMTNTSSSTTLLLVLDNVAPSDVGLYQCSVQEGEDIVTGDTLNLTGYYNIDITTVIIILCISY